MFTFVPINCIYFCFHTRANESLICGFRETTVQYAVYRNVAWENITEDKNIDWSEANCFNEHIISFKYSQKKSYQGNSIKHVQALKTGKICLKYLY